MGTFRYQIDKDGNLIEIYTTDPIDLKNLHGWYDPPEDKSLFMRLLSNIARFFKLSEFLKRISTWLKKKN